MNWLLAGLTIGLLVLMAYSVVLGVAELYAQIRDPVRYPPPEWLEPREDD